MNGQASAILRHGIRHLYNYGILTYYRPAKARMQLLAPASQYRRPNQMHDDSVIERCDVISIDVLLNVRLATDWQSSSVFVQLQAIDLCVTSG